MTAMPPRSCARWRAYASAASPCGGGAAPWACPPSTGGGPGVHRQRRTPEARLGQLVQVDASPFAWLGARGPTMSLHGAIDDATNTVLALHFRPTEDLHGYAVVFQQLFTQYGLPLAFYGDRINILIRNDPHWSLDEQLRGAQTPRTSAASCTTSGLAISRRAPPRPKAASSASGAPCRIASPANSACATSPPPRPLTPFCPPSWRTSMRASPGPRRRRRPPGAAPRAISPSCSAVAIRVGLPATTRSTSGRAGPAPARPPPALLRPLSRRAPRTARWPPRRPARGRRARHAAGAPRLQPHAPQRPKFRPAPPRATACTCSSAAFTRARGPAPGSGSTRQTSRQALPLSQHHDSHAPRRATRGAKPLPKRLRPSTPYQMTFSCCS